MTEDLSQAEKLLLTELFRLSQELSSFVRRTDGADSEDNVPVTPDDEWWLGVRLSAFGAVLRMRAASRRTANS